MKIITWNVNGVRAFINKGSWEGLEKLKGNIICLQEIKAKEDQLSADQAAHFNKNEAFWNSAKRPGYSGVMTLSDQSTANHSFGINEEDADVEGRVIRTDIGDLTIFNIYVPNGRRDHSRVDYKLNFYKELLATCDELHSDGRMVVLCGDFNTAHNEIDLWNHRQNHKTTGFLPSEREWISKFLEHGFVDIYRQSNPEEEKYTWWSYRSNARERNVGWRLDYFLISSALEDQVIATTIHDDLLGSDHCPVSLELDI